MAERRHRPIAAAAGDPVGEIGEQRRPLRRVHHFGMELHAVEAPLVVGDRGERRALAHRNDAKPRRQGLDPVAVAHPHLLAGTLGPQPGEQRAVIGDLDEGAAELAMVRGRDPAAELGAHQLLAIADAEHRHAGLEYAWRGERRRRLDHRGGTAGQYDRLGCELGKACGTDIKGVDLAIDAALAQPARDELGHLAAEIEDQDAVGHLARSSSAGAAGARGIARQILRLAADARPAVCYEARPC